jgi:hypothetical protein
VSKLTGQVLIVLACIAGASVMAMHAVEYWWLPIVVALVAID